jgi:hypothetical protein
LEIKKKGLILQPHLTVTLKEIKKDNKFFENIEATTKA